MIGEIISHYRIIETLGQGGMGVVYKAEDTRLHRHVALKFLPDSVLNNPLVLERFKREAKLLASLNHPNIAAIHGLEESGGTNFLVLELVDGETLADRIKAGPIPVEEALKLALQIAEALEAAHDKGIVHRDLKPSNVKVTPDGKVKVLDFGLAKAFAGEQADLNLSNSPTLSNAATQQGVILGTAAYMSPEQARGKAVDKRADIWAFGCVVYEMLTGQAAFQGEDVTEILAAVVRGGANLDLLPANLHPRVREVVSRCLQKDMKKRYRDVGDVQFELEQEDYLETQPRISSNRRWIAYTSGESGRNEVYVRPFPDVAKGRWQISATGGDTPLWSPNGRQLFYFSGDTVMAVSVTTEPDFSIFGSPQKLFQGPYACPTKDIGDAVSWDISPDGKRFLMIKLPGESIPTAPIPQPKINIVLNWFEELKQRVPVK